MKTFEQTVRERRSVRQYLPEPLSQSEIQAVLEDARHAPSAVNSQPWLLHIASGETLKKLEKALVEALQAGNLHPDFSYDQALFTGVYEDRYRECYAMIYEAAGIAREDKAGRAKFVEENMRFYGAPQAAFLFVPDTGDNVNVAFDAGIYAQTLMLSLTAHGFASVPQLMLAFFPNVVREILGVPANHKLIMGLSFGKEDTSASINTVRTPRAPLAETVFFHE